MASFSPAVPSTPRPALWVYSANRFVLYYPPPHPTAQPSLGRLAEDGHGRLCLSLVCNIDAQHPQALRVAESVDAPIFALPSSHLRECNIRLAKTADAQLQQVATDAVVHACGLSLFQSPRVRPPGTNRPSLATLPREIRILEYTDLVSPGRQINWGRQEARLHRLSLLRHPRQQPPEQRSRRPVLCVLVWHRPFLRPPPAVGCFCRRYHDAFSVTCKFWAPPGPTLFLLNRAMCEDARFIVFDLHIDRPWTLPRFNQCVEGGPIPRYRYPFGRLAASLFLRIVPQSALGHLRFLDLVFPPYRPVSWPEPQHPAMQDWWDTVKWLRGKINAPALTLCLVAASAGAAALMPDYSSATITDGEADTIMEAYINLMQPLVPLADEDGLARFYARLAHPRERTQHGWDIFYVEREFVREFVKEHAERYVTGSRSEDLYADGLEEPAPDD